MNLLFKSIPISETKMEVESQFPITSISSSDLLLILGVVGIIAFYFIAAISILYWMNDDPPSVDTFRSWLDTVDPEDFR